jgi:hypothetical protein
VKFNSVVNNKSTKVYDKLNFDYIKYKLILQLFYIMSIATLSDCTGNTINSCGLIENSNDCSTCSYYGYLCW